MRIWEGLEHKAMSSGQRAARCRIQDPEVRDQRSEVSFTRHYAVSTRHFDNLEFRIAN